MAVFNKLGSNLAWRSIGPRLTSSINKSIEKCDNLLLVCTREVGDIHQGYNMQGKLQENGEQDVEVEDVPKGTFARKPLDGLAQHNVNHRNEMD